MKKCSTRRLTEILGKKWTLELVQEIDINGINGFNALQKRIKKINPKVLSRRLKELGEQGILKKESTINNNLLKTRYTLTEKGRELCSIIDLLRHLNAKYDNRKCKTKNCIECELYQSSQL